MELTENNKRNSLLWYRINYRQILYSDSGDAGCRCQNYNAPLRLNPALPTNIRLGWQWLTVTNTLAYHGMKLITATKHFIVQDAGVNVKTLHQS